MPRRLPQRPFPDHRDGGPIIRGSRAPKQLVQLLAGVPGQLVVVRLGDMKATTHPTALAVLKVGFVVLGHVLGVISAHDRSVRLLPARHAVAGQVALLAVMVGYTVGGLLLLFST